MIELKGSKKEQAVRQWFNDEFNGVVPNESVINLFKKFDCKFCQRLLLSGCIVIIPLCINCHRPSTRGFIR